MLSDLPPGRRSAYLVGAAASAVWLVLCILYISLYVGWTSLAYLLLHEQALVLCGVFLPLVVLWLAIALTGHRRELNDVTAGLVEKLDELAYPAEDAEARVKAVADALREQARELNDATERSTADAESAREGHGRRAARAGAGAGRGDGTVERAGAAATRRARASAATARIDRRSGGDPRRCGRAVDRPALA